MANFLDLPPELRNVIYDFALIRDAAVDPAQEQQQPAITRSNRQIRAESLPVFYAGNRFVLEGFCCPCNYPGYAKRESCLRYRCYGKEHFKYAAWIRAIGYRNLRLIKTIRLTGGNIDVTLYQDIGNGRLTTAAELYWSIGGYRVVESWALGSKSPLLKMLNEVSDRKVQPGLSSCAIRKIIGLLFIDHVWYGKAAEKQKAW